MRHPTTGLSEDDLSRLTGSSSSTASCDSSSSSSSSSSAANTPAHIEGANESVHTLAQHPEKSSLKHNNSKNSHSHSHAHTHSHVSSSRFNSTYLPELINPLEWQKSRKRKERLDSTSSATQDRKLQRSNSEELLPQESAANPAVAPHDGHALKAPTKAADVIRRVSSEDFKKTASYAAYEQELINEADANCASAAATAAAASTVAADKEPHSPVADENDASAANRQQQQQQHADSLPTIYRENWVNTGPTKDMTRRSRYETSPARSQRFSPIRAGGNGNGNGKQHRDSDDSECEHERRRSSERFCKSRLPPGRKAAGVTKKSSSGGSSKHLSSKRGDENAYKYDLSALKYERRGFISKMSGSGGSSAQSSDHNDNNLIDFHQQKQHKANNSSNSASASPTQSCASEETSSNSNAVAVATSGNSTNTNNTSTTSSSSNANNIPVTSAQEALPWDRSVPEDQTPVLSRRYAAVRHHTADSLDTAAKLSKVMPYPQQFHKQSAVAQLLSDDMDCMEPLNTFRAFTSLENVRTRDVMQQVIPSMMSFQSPEERLKQVNKRLTALKKKLTQLEENYEARLGYRPSQAERLNDKYMKNIIAELNKLRKERHELKTDPMGALGFKVCGGMDSTKKLEGMKEILSEIEQNLVDKREDANRSDVLDELTADQLVQEKSAVQHGLLYFESLYGRPGTKDERDAARPLYDRYRQLKRMVSRSVMLSGSAVAGAPELPTILENEAMVFESTPQQYSSNNSTDTTNSPTESLAPNGSSDDSTTTTTGATHTAPESANTNTNTNTNTTTTTNSETQTAASCENVSALSLEQLWELLEKTREDKKLLKRTIREYETVFEEQNGRKMLKHDRKLIEETYAQYKEKKAKTRLLQELIKKQKRAFV